MPDLENLFDLTYKGARSDRHEIDFYDVSQALVGFQRSLALTTHLILNGEVITQAPSLAGAKFFALPPEEGSWRWTANLVFVGTALYGLTTAPRDSVLGNLVTSAYDYVISESLGFHVDFNSTLGQQYEEFKRQHPDAPALTESKMDSLIEKCEVAVKQLHRPLIESETADAAVISSNISGHVRDIGGPLSRGTYDYLQYSVRSEGTVEFVGRISSYNMNTFKGRAYLENSHRPVPFTLADSARKKIFVRLITRSLLLNAENPADSGASIRLTAYSYTSRTGRLKWLLVDYVETSSELADVELE